MKSFPQTWRKPIEWFSTASKEAILSEINRIFFKLQKCPGDAVLQERRQKLDAILAERQLVEQKEIAINNLLDHADPVTKTRVTPLLRELPLETLAKANPYAGNASDDCHTYSFRR